MWYMICFESGLCIWTYIFYLNTMLHGHTSVWFFIFFFTKLYACILSLRKSKRIWILSNEKFLPSNNDVKHVKTFSWPTHELYSGVWKKLSWSKCLTVSTPIHISMPFFPSGIGIEPQGLEDILSLPPIIPLPLSFFVCSAEGFRALKRHSRDWMPLLVIFDQQA